MPTNQQYSETDKKELAEIMNRPDLDIRLVTALAGERSLNAREKNILDRLKLNRGERLYTDMLYALTHKTFPPRQAKHLWADIIRHRGKLKMQLSRDVGISVASHDYLANVAGMIKNVSLIEETKMSSLANIANRDGLTGLYDQATFKLRLKEELERQQRYGGPLTLVMFDIDHFKKFNDTLGHAEGDIILKRVADIMMSQVRKMDTAARYGGEEFTVILPEVDLGAGYIFAERLRQNVEQAFSECEMPVTISIGLANISENIEEADDLIRLADKQLYRAKDNGRNQVCYATQ